MPGSCNGLDLAVGIENRNEDVVIDAATVRTFEWHLTTHELFAGDHLINVAIVQRCLPRVVPELQESLTDGFIPGFSPGLQQAVVRVNDAMIQIEDVSEIRCIGQDRFIESSLLSKRPLGTRALADIGRLDEDSAHCARRVLERLINEIENALF